jgi:hypothetical protein
LTPSSEERGGAPPVLKTWRAEAAVFPEADGEARMSMRKTGFGGTSTEATAEAMDGPLSLCLLCVWGFGFGL